MDAENGCASIGKHRVLDAHLAGRHPRPMHQHRSAFASTALPTKQIFSPLNIVLPGLRIWVVNKVELPLGGIETLFPPAPLSV